MAKAILITGASKGFGKLWAKAFLERGDKVAATARNIADLDDLAEEFGELITPIQLDVNDREKVFEAVKAANSALGSIDVLINNAGFGLFGAIEETSEDEARRQIETNLFGLLWVTQAVLPVMRKQASGHIIQVSSVLGLAGAPTVGLYNASKFAVEGLSESLAAEVAGFGIKVTIVEPNGFKTDWAGASGVQTKQLPAYQPLREAVRAAMNPDNLGEPSATPPVILQLVDSENPPLRLFLGKVGYPWIKGVYEQRLATWEDWKDLSATAQGS